MKGVANVRIALAALLVVGVASHCYNDINSGGPANYRAGPCDATTSTGKEIYLRCVPAKDLHVCTAC